METLRKFELVEQPTEYVYQLNWNNKLAVAIPRDLSYSRAVLNRDQFDPTSKMFCFNSPDNIHKYWLKILVRKEFPLLDELNQFIQYASEGGLIDEWIKKDRHSVEKAPKYEDAMDLEVFVVIWVVCGIMLLISSLVLIIEKITFKIVRRVNASVLWRLIEVCIDPNRYFLMNDLTLDE